MGLIISGLNNVRDLIDTDIDRGIMGTGTTIPARTDTALTTPVSATIATLTSTKTAKQLQKEYVLLPVYGNSSTLTEFGLYNNLSGEYWFKIIFSGINKTSSTQVRIRPRFFIRGRNNI